MTVMELLCELEGMNPDAEVRLAMQPNYPFEYSISQIIELPRGVLDEDEEADKDDTIVYLAEGEQLAYLPQFVSEHLNWKK